MSVFWLRVKTLVFLLLFKLMGTGGCEAGQGQGETELVGVKGGSITMVCQTTGSKHLCRVPCHVENILITDLRPAYGRYSLISNDSGEAFSVTITDLRAEDEGKYTCGTFVFTLKVKDGSSPTILSVSLAVVVALGMMGIGVFMFYRHRRQKTGCSNTGHSNQRQPSDCMYEEIIDTDASSSRPPHAAPTSVYAMAQLPTTHLDDPTYSTAKLPTTPSDDPTYCVAKLTSVPDDS
ncbi:hypothetical protein ACEWY4_017396 [Coilia grayii]|uniref:Immunoglobulin domain-containing protein n=1 Tax=Coilia grayii TaxID=363190 RepID=A0ABD1JH09_9TELE